jgi:hypothetical protein
MMSRVWLFPRVANAFSRIAVVLKPVGLPPLPFPSRNLRQLVVRNSLWLLLSEVNVRNSLSAGDYKIYVGPTLGEGTESWLFRYVSVLLSVVYGFMKNHKRASNFQYVVCVLLCVFLVLINHC